MKAITDKEGKAVIGYESDESTEGIIPNGVIKIESFAFAHCEDLINVIIPNSVKEIQPYAFYDCGNLKDIIIPSSITKIGEHAFSWCKNLTTITASDNLESIGNNPFYKCDNIQTVNVNSYKSYKLIRGRTKENFSFCATISIVKNYYNKIVEYTEGEIQDLKEYIIENRIKLFPYALKNIELYCVMFEEMNKIYSSVDVKNLLNKVRTEEYMDIKLEATAFLLNYMNQNDLIGKLPSLQELTLDDEEDIESKGHGLGK